MSAVHQRQSLMLLSDNSACAQAMSILLSFRLPLHSFHHPEFSRVPMQLPELFSCEYLDPFPLHYALSDRAVTSTLTSAA